MHGEVRIMREIMKGRYILGAKVKEHKTIRNGAVGYLGWNDDGVYIFARDKKGQYIRRSLKNIPRLHISFRIIPIWFGVVHSSVGMDGYRTETGIRKVMKCLADRLNKHAYSIIYPRPMMYEVEA